MKTQIGEVDLRFGKTVKIGAIVQARMSSQRFPNKVLYRVAGKPILQYLLERLRNLSNVIAAKD